MDWAIRTEGLTRDFGAVRAVDGLSLQVPKGAVFGFLGPNGSGKTTTLRLLLGLLDPTSGSAEVLGYDVRTQADEIRARVGALLEHDGLYERLTAEDNLAFYGRVYRLSPARRRERIEQLLTHLGLWERRHELVGEWSRGMKQKLAIARALLHAPPLLFLDEPTAGLDPVASAALREDIAGIARREGATVFLTTHNLPEAEKLCDLVGVIREGRLLAVGDPNTLRAQASRPALIIRGRRLAAALDALRSLPQVADATGRDGELAIHLVEGAEAAPLVAFLVSAGAEVDEVRRETASLEDVFMALVRETES
jgi:ABC-2 type transport system ATP-binding protein